MIDCNAEKKVEPSICTQDDKEISFDCSRFENTCQLHAQLSRAQVEPRFEAMRRAQFQSVFHHLIDWLSRIESGASDMRRVSLLELYIGFRLENSGRIQVSLGESGSDEHYVTAFTVDFSFFKKAFFHHVNEIYDL